MRILVTNDDGIAAPGLTVMQDIARVVVALLAAPERLVIFVSVDDDHWPRHVRCVLARMTRSYVFTAESG